MMLVRTLMSWIIVRRRKQIIIDNTSDSLIGMSDTEDGDTASSAHRLQQQSPPRSLKLQDQQQKAIKKWQDIEMLLNKQAAHYYLEIRRNHTTFHQYRNRSAYDENKQQALQLTTSQ